MNLVEQYQTVTDILKRLYKSKSTIETEIKQKEIALSELERWIAKEEDNLAHLGHLLNRAERFNEVMEGGELCQ